MLILKLTLKSFLNRKFTILLTFLSISLSVCLFVVVERTRIAARESFSNTISQTDLIVGGRTGSLQLLLYSIFHIGNATNNISYETFEKFSKHATVEWTVPISLGDSHKGHRVVATTPEFFQRYKFAGDQSLTFQKGQSFSKLFDVVIGAQVAQNLDYSLNKTITLAHGVSETGVTIQNHDSNPFEVVGILEPTGTPLDKAVFISLEAMEALHIDWQDGAPPLPGQESSKLELESKRIEVKTITSFLVRTKSRIQTLSLQRELSTYSDEPLSAIIPGVALNELWNTMSFAESALLGISFFVVFIGLLGMLISIYTSLNERRREIAILRAVGLSKGSVFGLFVSESTLLTILGLLGGFGSSTLMLAVLKTCIRNSFGIDMTVQTPSLTEWGYALTLLAFGVLLGFIPAWRAYRNSLSDGLSTKV